MTLRERIADWISGGMYRFWMMEAESKNTWRAKWHENERQRRQLAGRLSQIAAQETPNANATVKRMARVARGEEG